MFLSHIDFLDDLSIDDVPPGGISERESWWVERQEELEAAGYMLRPRYHPDWKPSWLKANKLYSDVEDGQKKLVATIEHGCDADLRRQASDVEEASQGGGPSYFRSISFFPRSHSSDPRNHCVPLLDVIELRDEPPILVHPLLRRHYDPRFQTFGEFVTFFSQTCEGVQFMHENHVAHRDCTYENVMLEPSNVYPNSFHPVITRRSKDYRGKAKGYSRTWRPAKYLLIDFGLSRLYDPAKGSPLARPIPGGDKSVPEQRNRKTPHNPFPTDVYYLGNLVREDYMERFHGFEFLAPLIDDMVQEDPTKRPEMSEVVPRLAKIVSNLTTWKLRSRMVRTNEFWLVSAWRSVNHWCRTGVHVLARKSAIPELK